MKISILVPLYNQAEYVSQCLDSLLDQTREAHEIIVVNDGSTDGGEKIVGNYPNIKLINQVNKGLSAARNTAIMHATGDYVLPVDADDMLLPEALEKINQVAEMTNADVISPSFQEFGLRATKIVLMPSPSLEDFKVANRVGYCSAIKRSALLEVGGYSPRMTWGYEDYHLWFDLLTRGKTFVTIPDILWLYRTKAYSMITESIKHNEELMGQIAKDFPKVFDKPAYVPTPLPQ
jgi:glycosyltransferase involved in cell wall biosynthesis